VKEEIVENLDVIEEYVMILGRQIQTNIQNI
jgi:hypothetical protein